MTLDETTALQLVESALGIKPLRAVRQTLSESGKSVYRIDLPDGRSAALRTSDRPHTFAFTPHNLKALAALGLPVQSFLASGATKTGGSYIILTWIPGEDLKHALDKLTPEQMTRLAGDVVHCQRRVGTLPAAAKFGWAPIGRSGNLNRWTDVFGEAASPHQARDGTRLGELRADLCLLRARVEPYFAAIKPVAFLDDLTTKNVLIDGGVITGIIDVDFVCYGDPLLSVGATMAQIAADHLESTAFYGEEIMRCWDPDPIQHQAILFYAALWGVGLLQFATAQNEPDRARVLDRAVESWLSSAQTT